VKCNEEKSACPRSIRLSIKCDGYVKSSEGSKVPRKLGSTVLIAAPLLLQSSLLFSTEDEGQYYRFYVHSGLPLATFVSASWRSRDFHEERDYCTCILKPVTECGDAAPNIHHEFALLQYARALQCMRAKAKNNSNCRTALMGSLIVFSLEV